MVEVWTIGLRIEQFEWFSQKVEQSEWFIRRLNSLNELFEDWGGLEVLQKGWGEYTSGSARYCRSGKVGVLKVILEKIMVEER